MVNSIKLPAINDNTFKYLQTMKRHPLQSGPYKDVSLFEASNRIFSDIVILFGINRLLTDPIINNIKLPFDEYDVVLGVEGGNDIRARKEDRYLIGEAFNVAKSFFQTKKSRAIKELNKKESFYRLIVFNEDAVNNSSYYVNKSTKEMLYLPIDIWENFNMLLKNQR